MQCPNVFRKRAIGSLLAVVQHDGTRNTSRGRTYDRIQYVFNSHSFMPRVVHIFALKFGRVSYNSSLDS